VLHVKARRSLVFTGLLWIFQSGKQKLFKQKKPMQTNRRSFIKSASIAGVGLVTVHPSVWQESFSVAAGKRVGIIGLDTSHSIAFTKTLNNPEAGPQFGGYRVVAAFPQGSLDIASSVERIPGYTRDIQALGVEITASVEELLEKTDVILLETNDGRRHLEQAIQVYKAGKTVFIDKPVAGSLTDAMAIYEAANDFKVPVFSSSSLRYMSNMKDILQKQVIGRVLGADAYSPATLEATHPDLFWYGIHGVEALYTVMGTGCKSVARAFTPDTDLVTGVWNDNRIGTFRGLRSGKTGYGGVAYGEKGILSLGDYNGYNPLLEEIVKFFQTGIAPVPASETLEIFTFMEAADESKRRMGAVVELEEVWQKASRKVRRNWK